MNIKIRSFFAVISLIVLPLFAFIIINIINLKQASFELREIEQNRHLMILKADELRQSSDDLSKFARKYVISRDKVYKENYFKVLAIRQGITQKPLFYSGIYWDLSPEKRAKHHPLSQKISLNEEMKNLPYTDHEFAKLQIAENNSNALVALEVEAFNALSGLFKDAAGEYTIKGAPNQELAIRLINSKSYEKAKESIMSPIDDFLISLQTRTESSILLYNKKINDLFHTLFTLLALLSSLFLVVIVLIYKKILNPIDELSHAIVDFQNGKKDLKELVFYNDEFGLMAKQFFAMKRKMDDDYENIKQLALHDQLTGTHNRRYFFEISQEFLKLSIRKRETVSLLMLDIDFFKKINDKYGHLIGDEILIYIVNTTQNSIRESDILARFGGEEFVVFLPNTHEDDAYLVAQNIRKNIQDNPYVKDNQSIEVTISIGLAQHNCTDANIEINSLINRADEALYRAKTNGRNRVEIG